MNGVRRRLTIVGPGANGCLKAKYTDEPDDCVIDVLAEQLPASLRLPNATFVALIAGRDLVRVETAGESWLDIQDKIRGVLNDEWDPIGVADAVADEYDDYIDELYALVKSDASEDAIAEHLRSIEAIQMELRPSPLDKLREVARSLRVLRLPDLDLPESAG